MDVKTCTKCGDAKPLGSFPRMTRSKDGRAARCSDCKRAIDRAAYAANPDRKREQSRRWAKDNPDRKREQTTRSAQKFRNSNPERVRAIKRQSQAKRRAAQRGADFGDVDWEAVRQSGTHCHICGCRLPRVRTADNTQPDHLVALAAGGAHSMRNLAPAHARCNNLRLDAPLPGLMGAWTIRPVTCTR